AVLWFVATVSIGPCRPVPPSFPTRRSSDLQIFVGSHDGHAAHRNVFSQVLATLGEHDSERLGGDDSILEEQLIEVAHPIPKQARSEEHTSELQSREKLVCRLLLEKKQTSCANPWVKRLRGGRRSAGTTPLKCLRGRCTKCISPSARTVWGPLWSIRTLLTMPHRKQ